VADRAAPAPEAGLDRSTFTAETARALQAALTEREQLVIALRFGLAGQPRTQLEKVGERLGVTRERVRQIEEVALRKLRLSRDTRRLLALQIA